MTKVEIIIHIRKDQLLEYIAKKYRITLIKKQSKFERDYPLMMERIRELELEVFNDGVERIWDDLKKEGTD